ncbi:MAG: hypothetical protein RIF32_04990 [Leptospirales bacterium]
MSNDPLELHRMLPQFNQDGEEYKKLIGDPSRPPAADPIRLPNDLDRGSVENVIAWSNGFQERALNETNLQHARDILLDAWADFYGFQRQPGMSDEEFIGHMLGTILSSVAARPIIYAILPAPTFQKFHAAETGFFAGISCAGVPVVRPGRYRLAAAITTQKSNAIYAYVDDLDSLTDLMRAQINTVIAAGFDVFVGEY